MLEDIRTHPTVVEELPSVSAIVRFLIVNLEWVVEAKDWHPSDAVDSSILDIDDTSFQNLEGPSERDIAREYIEGLLRANPDTEDEALSRLLGYRVNPPNHLREARERQIHVQRARDILGPEVWDMKRRCEEKGIFHDGLSVDQFFSLVSNGAKSEAMLEDTRKTIELKMRHFVAMVEENAHVFGVEERARAEEMRRRLGVKWEVGEREE
jgi:hypothetical protein